MIHSIWVQVNFTNPAYTNTHTQCREKSDRNDVKTDGGTKDVNLSKNKTTRKLHRNNWKINFFYPRWVDSERNFKQFKLFVGAGIFRTAAEKKSEMIYAESIDKVKHMPTFFRSCSFTNSLYIFWFSYFTAFYWILRKVFFFSTNFYP